MIDHIVRQNATPGAVIKLPHLRVTALLIAALCHVPTFAGPTQEPEGAAPLGAAPGLGRLLTLPKADGPVVVRAAFHLQNINEIDEEAETFQFSGVLTLVWQDRRQAFDPVIAGVQEQIYQGAYQFDEVSPAWYPQVLLANGSGMYETPAVLLRVKPDGTSRLVMAVNAVAESKLNLRRCPFDGQRLEAVFAVFGFDVGEVVLEAEPIAESIDGRDVRIPQWTLVSVRPGTDNLEAPHIGGRQEAAAFVLTIEVQRQWFFLVRLVILPLALIVMLSWSVFWMDRSLIGDRLSVSWVGLLTAVAYLLVISDKLPQIAHVTLIHAFVSFSFLTMCATVPASLMVGACNRTGNSARGERIDRICRRAFPLAYTVLISTAVVIAFTVF